jgi:outer membrane protein
MSLNYRTLSAALAGCVALAASPVGAQDDPSDGEKRTRVALGPQVKPSWPGADDVSFGPLIDFATAYGDTPFDFEAPDESFGFSVATSDSFALGPVLSFETKRASADVGGILPDVDFSLEVGGFVNYTVSDSFRLRAEARQGVTGHDGFIAVVGADFVIRDADEYLLSIGPRVTITDNSYQDAYYSVTPAQSAASGLSAYEASGGFQSVGVVVGYIQQLTDRWGVYSYAQYDRLVDDAANSPVVLTYGSRDQYSGGIALTYTFDGGIF